MLYTAKDYQGFYNLKRAERMLILQSLAVSSNKTIAAKRLGISERALHDKLRLHSINYLNTKHENKAVSTSRKRAKPVHKKSKIVENGKRGDARP